MIAAPRTELECRHDSGERSHSGYQKTVGCFGDRTICAEAYVRSCRLQCLSSGVDVAGTVSRMTTDGAGHYKRTLGRRNSGDARHQAQLLHASREQNFELGFSNVVRVAAAQKQ